MTNKIFTPFRWAIAVYLLAGLSTFSNAWEFPKDVSTVVLKCHEILQDKKMTLADQAIGIIELLEQLYTIRVQRGDDMDWWREQIDELIEMALSPAPSEVKAAQARAKVMFNSMKAYEEQLAKAPLMTSASSIIELSMRPDLLRADQKYSVPNPLVDYVIFDPALVKELEEMPEVVIGQFMRAIQRGFVTEWRQGLKRITEVHRNLVTVKIQHNSYRLIGCLQGKYLKILKLDHKTNDDLYLYKFAGLCK